MDLRKLPFANLARNAGRTAGLGVLAALIAFVLFGGTAVVASLQNGLASMEARLGADVVVVPKTAVSHVDIDELLLEGVPGSFYMDASYLGKVAAREGVERVSAQYYLATVRAGCCSMPVQIIGFDPNADFTVQPWVARTFGGDLGREDVLVGSDMDKPVGSTVRFYGVDCTVAGQLEKTGTALDRAVFATADTVRDLIQGSVEQGISALGEHDPGNVISTIQIKVAPGHDASAVARDINAHVRGVKAAPARDVTSGVADSVAGMAGVVGVLMAVAWLVAAIVLFAAFTVAGKQREGEFATLRILGASRRAMAGIVVKESAIVSAGGALVGVAVGVAVLYLFGLDLEAALGLPFLMPSVGALAAMAAVAFAVTLAVGCAASLLSAMRLSRAGVAERAVGHEG